MSGIAAGARRGRFITFEGGEGAGKSTQVARLADHLRLRMSCPVVTTREPGGSPRAEAIREALLSGIAKRHGPFAEALLFSAARIDHLDTLIAPALARGEVVLCDRFLDSTRAYQGAAGGLDPALLRSLERVVVGPILPDLTLILDIDPLAGLQRARARAADGAAPDRFEAEALGFHQRLRDAFLTIAAAEPERCAVVDAARDPDEIEAVIWGVLTHRLPDLLPADATGTHHDAA